MKVLLFRVHAGDPLSTIIQDETRTEKTHAALLIDQSSNEICEAYVPHVRFRNLADSELPGIDAYDIVGMDEGRAAGVLAYCKEAVAAHEPYSVENLFRFNAFFRKFIGEAYDRTVHDPVICSQFVFDALDRGGRIRLLNAPSYVLAPGYLEWSTLLIPSTALAPIGSPQ